jgi:hypothetical protein
MSRNEDPIIVLSSPNEDNTMDYQCGSMSPFDIVVVHNGNESKIPAQHAGYHFYSYGDTLPSDVHVETTR